ncbi:hypothetical protein IW261DRAFT_1455859 [Armillaria novae-zelandiae]|uniref:Uncharacterized protein n=1 Tax=Armillaria novae-zelandiae TaxID=153914 RepID=A0AA39UER9_9AGAR|nr:hypothetical protein IW261DRAFT_1455859 [Armillaria novae-zelandiae]
MIFTHDAFATFGNGFGDIEALPGMYLNWFTVPIMSAVSACIGQAFYAYRIFILSKSLLIPIFVICVSLTSLVAGIVTGVWCFPIGKVIELNSPRMTVAIGILCGSAALCDIIIAILMTYYLMRSNTGLRPVVALLSFVLFLVFPHQTFYGTPTLIVAKLYANNVYMVLNSRIRIIGGRDTYTDMIQSTEGTRPTDRIQGRVPSVVTITPEVFNDDHGMGQEKNKSHDSNIGPSV